MIIPLFLSLLIVFFTAFLIIGKKAKANIKNNEDYFLMGRNLGFIGLTMTLLATQLGGGVILGAAEEAYLHGWQVLLYPLGMTIGLACLAFGFGGKLRTLQLSTISELFERLYSSPLLRKVASCLSILSLFFVLTAQAIAAKKFFFSLGFQNPLFFILFWFVFLGYTVMGGLKAVVKTDIIQAGFILLVFMAVALFSMMTPSPFPESVISSTFTPNPSWFSWLLMPLLFVLISQDMGQRCFAAKEAKTISRASLVAALVFLIASLLPIYYGVMANTLNLEIEGSILMGAISQLTHPTLATFFSFAILMAIISTADSLLCSISSNLAQDFTQLKKDSVTLSQWITFGVGIAALLLSFFFNSVVGMIIFSYEISVSVLSVPILMAVFKKVHHKRSAIISMVVGGITFLLCTGISLPFPKELLILALSFGSYFMSDLLSRYSQQLGNPLNKEAD